MDQYWEVLNRFTLNQARDYLLWVKTLEKERRSLVLLDQEQKVTDREIVKVYYSKMRTFVIFIVYCLNARSQLICCPSALQCVSSTTPR